ncbi:hypothetical protein MUK42_08466 [Musa troglodytarum]|uniref:Uncharacterized protein n=1 Tax=Musa troglodytarum TaxID=320322 RepID=A0A9E7IFF2_9LILI|nr:hypothetical protein MUK42_08466 [Musa troglodytarum]
MTGGREEESTSKLCACVGSEQESEAGGWRVAIEGVGRRTTWRTVHGLPALGVGLLAACSTPKTCRRGWPASSLVDAFRWLAFPRSLSLFTLKPTTLASHLAIKGPPPLGVFTHRPINTISLPPVSSPAPFASSFTTNTQMGSLHDVAIENNNVVCPPNPSTPRSFAGRAI